MLLFELETRTTDVAGNKLVSFVRCWLRMVRILPSPAVKSSHDVLAEKIGCANTLTRSSGPSSM